MTMRDEYFDYPYLDRLPVIIKHKDAFYEWLKTALTESFTPHDKEDSTIYLLEGTDYEYQWVDILKENYMEMFGHELHSWLRDDKSWPKDMSWEKFNEFFSYSFSSGSVNMLPDVMLVDEGDYDEPGEVSPEQLHMPAMKALIKNIADHLYKVHGYLIENDLSERSVAHHMAMTMQAFLSDFGYDVDVEYNRMTDKQGKSIKKTLNIDTGNREKAVYPDIIAHRRGTDEGNLLAVEIKIQGHPGDREFDLKKLEAYCKELGYAYGVFIELGKKGIVEEIWFKKGKKV